jgi:hypothetical protein
MLLCDHSTTKENEELKQGVERNKDLARLKGRSTSSILKIVVVGDWVFGSVCLLFFISESEDG